jgi:TIR domain
MSSVLPHEVFLSHTNQDRGFVDSLAEVMRRHGLPVWYSQTNILGAQQWHDEIGAALRRCDWFLVVLSPQSVESTWVKREVMYAFEHDRYDNKIVSVIYQSCDYEEKLSWILPQFQMVDFTRAIDQGYVDLLRVWGLGYQK